jgi:PIN domain nuclease of toxin-antitoxin system
MTNFLLDSTVLLRRLFDPRKLSRDQNRIIDQLEEGRRPFDISAITLLELSLLSISGNGPSDNALRALQYIEESENCEILPLSTEIARETRAIIGILRDPYDATIVATARVHRLKLLTSDQRIIEAGLVSVVE